MIKLVEIIHKWLSIAGFKYRDKSKIELSLNLIDEEIKELKQAILANDKEAMLDAYADIIYVLNNFTYFQGFSSEEIENYINKVTKSNYSKFSDDLEMMQESCRLYALGEHPFKKGEKIEAEVYETCNIEYPYILKNVKTGKILKPLNFKEPNAF